MPDRAHRAGSRAGTSRVVGKSSGGRGRVRQFFLWGVMKTDQPQLELDPAALATITSFLEESGYFCAVSRTVGREPFPDFGALQSRVGNASPFHQLALSLF